MEQKLASATERLKKIQSTISPYAETTEEIAPLPRAEWIPADQHAVAASRAHNRRRAALSAARWIAQPKS